MSGQHPVRTEDAGQARAIRRGRAAAAVGAFVPQVARAAFETHGFPSAAILTDWPDIAGPDFAGFTAPERLVWPRRQAERSEEDRTLKPSSKRREGATLVLRVDGPRALEVQHAAPQLLERVNVYFGYAAVVQLRIVQAPIRKAVRAAPEPAPPRAPRPDPRLDAIDDEGLRGALARLGARIETQGNDPAGRSV